VVKVGLVGVDVVRVAAAVVLTSVPDDPHHGTVAAAALGAVVKVRKLIR